MEDLFAHCKARIHHFQFCLLQEVRTRVSSFLNWLCDSCRSCDAGETELWIIDFHAKLNELCCFEDSHVDFVCFDLFCLVRIRLNHVWIRIVGCKIYKMMCSFLIFVNICSWASRTRWRLLENFPECMFDPLGYDIRVCMCLWSVFSDWTMPFPMKLRDWPVSPCWLWLTGQHINETQCFMCWLQIHLIN